MAPRMTPAEKLGVWKRVRSPVVRLREDPVVFWEGRLLVRTGAALRLGAALRADGDFCLVPDRLAATSSNGETITRIGFEDFVMRRNDRPIAAGMILQRRRSTRVHRRS